MNTLYDNIFKRKSVRKYQNQLISDDIKNKIYEAINRLTLYNKEKSTLRCEILTYDEFLDSVDLNFITKKMVIKSPYYISIYRNVSEDSYVNAGYIGEELILRLKELHLDTCWVGAANVFDKGEDFIIGIAFGYSDVDDNIKRNRKDISAYFIGTDPDMTLLNALREAPSAKNSQPVYLEFKENLIKVYYKKPERFLKDLNKIDMGIALRHITLYLEKENIEYEINKKEYGYEIEKR